MNEQKPDIIIIMADQLRYDCISSAGHPTVKTPALDRLCKMGTRFERCYTTCPVCMPARSSFASGLFSHNHGQWFNYKELNPAVPTYMKALRDSGYHTAHIGKSHLYEHRLGQHLKDYIPFMQKLGFDDILETTGPYATLTTNSILTDHWNDLGLLETFQNDYRKRLKAGYVNSTWASPIPDGECMDDFIGKKAISYINNYNKNEPLCAFIGFGGPHDPWDPSDKWYEKYINAEVPATLSVPKITEYMSPQAIEYQNKTCNTHIPLNNTHIPVNQEKEVRRLYYAKVSQVDYWVGQLLDTLEKRGNKDNTFILFWSDHGERLCDRGAIHKAVFYDESARVPLIIKRPDGERAGSVSSTLCSTVDMTATICQIAGVKTVGFGKSLLEASDKKAEPLNEYVFSEIDCAGFYTTMIRSEEYKMLIDSELNTLQLFDMSKDPFEMDNLAGNPDYSELETKLKNEILRWRLSTELDCRLNT